MGQMTEKQINVSLFDEVKRLRTENITLQVRLDTAGEQESELRLSLEEERDKVCHRNEILNECAHQINSLTIELSTVTSDALRSAAEHRPVLMNGSKDSFADSWIECSCGGAKANGTVRYEIIWREHILGLAPVSARLDAELREWKVRLEEAVKRHKHRGVLMEHGPDCDECRYRAELTAAISAIEKEREALK